MKKTILLGSLVFTFYCVQAQESSQSKTQIQQSGQTPEGKKVRHENPEVKANHFVTKMNDVVKLDPKQYDKVKSLALDHFVTMETARKNAKGNKELIKAEAKKSKQIFHEGLKKVLSPQQLELWKSNKKAQGKKQDHAPVIEGIETIDE